MHKALLLLLFWSIAAFGMDISGKRTASFETQIGSQTRVVRLCVIRVA
jgi:hypothetical protein